MEAKQLVKTLSPIERKIIPYIKNGSNLKQLTKESKISEIQITRAIQFLENKKVLTVEIKSENIIKLGKGGLRYKKIELPERIFIKILKNRILTLAEIKDKVNLVPEELNVCIGLLKSKAAIEVVADKEPKFKLSTQGEKLLDKLTPEEELFNKIKQNSMREVELTDVERFALNNLKKRKELIEIEEDKNRIITLTELGKKLLKEDLDIDLIEGLTTEVIKSEEWKKKEFRHYDIQINVPKINSGRRHPYNEALNKIRQVFLEMGFKEMEGPWVETAFWGMDSMWIAQDHPMRDVQDTFYLDISGDLPDRELIKRVKAAHENGYNTGSTGHTKEWIPTEAAKLILRQHSTATTYRYFHYKKLNHPCKYFYIANNFRNETIDATHLPEFGQAEGFIMGDNLTLADLMGFVKEFYAKLGITKIKFKPTFNPYTEPSMEAHYYNEKLGKWYALINSGIFRPEALAPYGITKSVIAWGMGSSRIAALLTNKLKLKDLIGPEVSFDWIRKHKRVNKLE